MTIQENMLRDYRNYLLEQEHSPSTLNKYIQAVTEFGLWLGDAELTKARAAEWKSHICDSGLKPESVNGKLTAVNGFLAFLGKCDCRVKRVKIQKKMFRDQSRELSRQEYDRLVSTAQKLGKERLALLLETICGTGIRVSEVKYITLDAVQGGKAEIRMKGKIRVILLPESLRKKLRKYAKKQRITGGAIFRTRTGKNMSRTQIWSEMKALCKKAGVEESKVFPHNLRHLFALAYYRVSRNIVQLADILGHSSVETTRIYLIGTGKEHARAMERLGLIS